MATLTSLNFVTPSAITPTAQIHVVITGDTSQGNPDGSSYKANLSDILSIADTYVTGFTYNDANTFTIKQNQGQSDLNASFNIVTGLTVNGVLSATTISADTMSTTTISANTLSATSFYVNGQVISNISWVTRTNASSQLYNIPSVNYGIINRYTLNPYSEYVLPATCAIGDIIEFIEDKAGSSITRVRANAGQTIRVGSYGTTGTAGYFDTVNTDNVAIKLVCITANSKWAVVSYFSDFNNGAGSIPTIV